MFQFSGLALFRVLYLQYNRLSHSEIFGLSLVCSYPKLIAAYHVLHRLLVPRHPPYALIRFKYCCFISIKFKVQSIKTNHILLRNSFLLPTLYSLLHSYLTTCFILHRLQHKQKLLSQYVKEL